MYPVSFYIAQYLVRGTAQSRLHFAPPSWPVHSDTNLAHLGSILAMQQLHTNTIHISTALYNSQVLIYSFRQLIELGHHGDNENAKTSNSGSLDCKSGILDTFQTVSVLMCS